MSRALMALALAALAPGAAAAQYPIFDAHIHYHQPDRDAYTPERILSILARAGVHRALVSSTPDEGTLALYQRAPAGIVPALRPSRPADPAFAADVEKRLERGVYRAIGEVHFTAGDVGAPAVKQVAELAVQRDLFLWCHVDAAAAEAVLARYPGLKLLWAHAGMSAPPRRVGELVDRYPRLWVELALRTDVAPDGALDPDWRALFLRHPDRFLVGTDTWETSRWERVRSATEAVQHWLLQLPREVAEQIAWRNGERLFPRP